MTSDLMSDVEWDGSSTQSESSLPTGKDRMRGPLPDPPDGRQWCAAHSKQTGLPCKKWAVPGATVCLYHGAGAPQVRAKAARNVAEAKVLSETARTIEAVAAEARGMHPIETAETARGFAHAMMQVLATAQTETDLSGDVDPESAALAESVRADLFRRWTELAMRAAKSSLDAGVDERRIRLDAAQGDVLASGVRRFADALAVGLEERGAPPGALLWLRAEWPGLFRAALEPGR